MIFKSSRIISLTFFAALILIPSLIVVLGSFKTDSEVYNKPLSLPENWNLDNYQRLIFISHCLTNFALVTQQLRQSLWWPLWCL
ncbi:hypothetical protein A1s21148_06320 [Candidatus Planktophila lacus]|uniref:Uncharacterized protein n=1 Tax=Candidatus Planktophila lacus TaxID=1884913 RepID=A0AAC9YRJ3_9ACTN|nr:hypothetical protein A1s21148_06320 [Candidatus Planktophila lacus]